MRMPRSWSGCVSCCACSRQTLTSCMARHVALSSKRWAPLHPRPEIVEEAPMLHLKMQGGSLVRKELLKPCSHPCAAALLWATPPLQCSAAGLLPLLMWAAQVPDKRDRIHESSAHSSLDVSLSRTTLKCVQCAWVPACRCWLMPWLLASTTSPPTTAPTSSGLSWTSGLVTRWPRSV